METFCGFFAASKVQVTLRDLGIQSEAGLPEYSWTVGEFLLSSNVCLRLGKRNLRVTKAAEVSLKVYQCSCLVKVPECVLDRSARALGL